MSEFFNQVLSILDPGVLFNSHALMETLKRPEIMIAAYVTLTLIIFTETGLLIGFFLPGDSLLVTVGMVVHATQTADPTGGWSLSLLMVILSIAAIVGDSVGYSIGYKAGPKIFSREKSLLFAKDHLVAAQTFYEKHGGKTIVLARFMPIIRTFAPVVAGVGQMHYRKFLAYNIVGGIAWVVSMLTLGYYLTTAIDPIFQRLTSNPEFSVERHVEKVIILIVALSVAPMGIAWLRSRMRGKKPAATPTSGTPTQVG